MLNPIFNLDREVTAWAAAVHAERCRPEAGVAELSDHLYCEIDRARTEGLSEEEAFRTAVARLGTPSDLAAEHAKNRGALAKVCRVAAAMDGGTIWSADQRRLLTAHSMIWASMMIATSIVMTAASLKAAAAVSLWLITVIYTPLWWSSEQLLRRALRRGAGGAQ